MKQDASTFQDQEDRPVYYMRFRYFHRFLHALIIISFMGLVLTGMPLKYSEAGWARALAVLLGGIQTAGYIHRVCGVITFLYFTLHILWTFYFIVFLREGPLLAFIFGPDSMVPWKTLQMVHRKGSKTPVRSLYILGEIRLPRSLLGRRNNWSFRPDPVVPRVLLKIPARLGLQRGYNPAFG